MTFSGNGSDIFMDALQIKIGWLITAPPPPEESQFPGGGGAEKIAVATIAEFSVF